jgi:hypothetical protein
MFSRIIIEIEHATENHLNPNDAMAGISEAFFNLGIGPDEEDGERWMNMDGGDYTVVGFRQIQNTIPDKTMNRGF